MMSRNSYKIETLRNGQWLFRMLNEDAEYLREKGEEWKRGGMIEDYRVSPK